MELFFAKKPKIMTRPADGKVVISYYDICNNAELPFTHICNSYNRYKELQLYNSGLIINGENYRYQNGFDINEVIFNIYNRFNVNKIRFLNSFIDITVNCNKNNAFEIVSFKDVLKTDIHADIIEIIFSNEDINFEFNIVF